MITFLIQDPQFSRGIVNFVFGRKHLSFLHSLCLLLKRKSQNKIRNGKLWGINYPFQKGAISSLKFVPGICILTLDGFDLI